MAVSDLSVAQIVVDHVEKVFGQHAHHLWEIKQTVWPMRAECATEIAVSHASCSQWLVSQRISIGDTINVLPWSSSFQTR